MESKQPHAQHHHNPHCPKCGCTKTRKKGTRNGKNRYWCNGCTKYFSVDHNHHRPALWVPYVDGVPLRKLGDEIKLSPSETYNIVEKEMLALPDNTYLTNQYCNRWSGILILDGKYVKVRGYEQKIPFIYGIDYLTHDIPVGILAPSENDESFKKIFRLLKTCNYPLQAVVGDDRVSLSRAVFHYYPKAVVQHCHNHFVENIRQRLHIRTDKKYHHFFNSMYKHLFHYYKKDKFLNDALHHLLTKRTNGDVVLQSVVMEIWAKRKELFAYPKVKHCPKDTNLIELYNSHLQARLKSIKGFKSFAHAACFLNAYMIRRRFKNFTDCDTKFKRLNGHCSFEQTLKKQASMPEIFGLDLAPKIERLGRRSRRSPGRPRSSCRCRRPRRTAGHRNPRRFHPDPGHG